MRPGVVIAWVATVSPGLSSRRRASWGLETEHRHWISIDGYLEIGKHGAQRVRR